jgi:hypothetical protein
MTRLLRAEARKRAEWGTISPNSVANFEGGCQRQLEIPTGNSIVVEGGGLPRPRQVVNQGAPLSEKCPQPGNFRLKTFDLAIGSPSSA